MLDLKCVKFWTHEHTRLIKREYLLYRFVRLRPRQSQMRYRSQSLRHVLNSSSIVIVLCCTVATSHQRHIERNISRRKHIRTNRTCTIKSNAYVMATLRKPGFSFTTVCRARVAVSLVVFCTFATAENDKHIHPDAHTKTMNFFFFNFFFLARKKRNVCTQIDNFRVELPLALLQCAILPLTQSFSIQWVPNAEAIGRKRKRKRQTHDSNQMHI